MQREGDATHQQTAFINCIPSVCHTEEPPWTSYSPMQQHCMQSERDSTTHCMQRAGDSTRYMQQHCIACSVKEIPRLACSSIACIQNTVHLPHIKAARNSHLPRQMKTIQSKRPSTKTRPSSIDYYCQQSTRYGSSVKTTTDQTNQQHEANKRLH